jgi:hypothetical protein
MKNKILFLALVVAVSVWSCSENTTDPNPTSSTEVSTFSLIQDQILTPSCATAGCHASDKDGGYAQHKLVLAKGVAYKNLVNAACQNQLAQNDNFQRVKPFKSLESLLFHKLNWDAAHHGGKTYGSPMPLGGKSLFVGQIEFVRRWIEAGAPEKGDVVDRKLLDDKTDPAAIAFVPLATPTQEGLAGFQLAVERFELPPNFEREIFVRKPVGNTSTVYVNRIKLKARPNSHHMVIYDFRNKALLPSLNTVRDLRNSDNTVNLATALSISNHIFLGGGTDPNSDYVFPEGMAIELPANATVDLNPHYFNKTNGVLYGENYVNMYTVDKAKVQKVVRMIDFNNTSFTLPAKQKTTITKSFTFSTNVNIVALTSHNHKYGEKFVIKISGGTRNGEIVYENTDWEHPAVINFKTPLVLKKGEGLTSVVTYNNTSDKAIGFGLTSEDEMNIIFGYYFED